MNTTIPNKPAQAAQPGVIWTGRSVKRRIPPKWNDAEVTIADNIGQSFRIKSIALKEDAHGRRIIILSTKAIGE